MNEERKTPQSTAELAYGRTDTDAPTRPPEDERKDGRPDETMRQGNETMESMTPPGGDGERRPTIGERPREVTDTSMAEAPLLDQTRTADYSTRWHEVQAKFAEEPKDAVREADGLVAEVIQALATSFADHRQELEGKWDSGTDVTTEDLRQALIQYRSFFQRLLAA